MSFAATEARGETYARGALLVLAAGLLWSTTGALLRSAPDLDSWQFLVFRSFGTFCALLIYVRRQDDGGLLRRFAALGPSGGIVVIAMTVATVGFIVAINETTVANAQFLNACSPLLSSLLGAVVLKERLTGGIVVAMLVGLAGVAIMVAGEVEAGNLFGNAAALLSALGFAVAGVCLRRARGNNFLPAMLGFAALSSAIALGAVLVRGGTLALPPLQSLAAFGNGFVFMGAGFALFVRGAPHIPAAGQTVLTQTETVFGPFWVWLFFAEMPLPTTLVGGAIVLAAVVGMALSGARRASAWASPGSGA
jgi:DME family drug/metabolite transporter